MKKLTQIVMVCAVLFSCDNEEEPREIPEEPKEPKPKVYVGDVTLRSQASVDEWTKNEYEQVIGNLHLGGCFSCGPDHHELISSNIKDLSALINLKRVTGYLGIFFTEYLTSLHGLDSLSYVGNLTIDDVVNLTSYDALNGLDSINGSMNLSTNIVMTNFDSFGSLTYLKGQLAIETHRKIVSITGFSKLGSIGSFRLTTNGTLVDISGFSNLKAIKTDFSITGNKQLKDLCSLSQAVINGPLEGYFSIEANAYNPTRDEIVNGNCSQ